MAIIYVQGFDTAPATTTGQGVSGSHTYFIPGRFGGRAVGATLGTHSVSIDGPTNLTHIIFGFAYAHTSGTATNLILLQDSGSFTTAALWVYGDGRVELRLRTSSTSYGTILASGPPGTAPTGDYNYFEIRYLLAASPNGQAELRVNGVTVGTFSGGNTRYSSATVMAGISYSGSSNNTYLLDDMYIIDPEVAPNTTFLGDCRIKTLMPVGNGSASELVNSDGNSVDNFLKVNTSPVVTTSFTGSDVVDAKDLYAFPSFSPVGPIMAVQTGQWVFKTDEGGARKGRALIKSGATQASGNDRVLSTALAYDTLILATNPATGLAWTEAEVNTIEAGFQVRGA